MLRALETKEEAELSVDTKRESDRFKYREKIILGVAECSSPFTEAVPPRSTY